VSDVILSRALAPIEKASKSVRQIAGLLDDLERALIAQSEQLATRFGLVDIAGKEGKEGKQGGLRSRLLKATLAAATQYQVNVGGFSGSLDMARLAWTCSRAKLTKHENELEYLKGELKSLKEMTTTDQTWRDVTETWQATLALLKSVEVERGRAVAPPLLPPLVISLPSGVFIADTDFGCTLASCSRHVASLPLILRLRPSSISLLCLDQDGWYLGPACSGLFPVVHGAAICLPPPPGCSPAQSALCGLRCLAMAASDAVALFATRFDFSVDHRRRTGDMASGQGLLLCVLCRTLTLLILLSILLLLWFSSSRLLRHHPASSTRPFRIFVFEPMVFAAA